MRVSNTFMPILSVIIPTRNRFHYVKSAIISILEFSDYRIELVIQDNSDSNQLMIWVNENINDSRLIYNYSNTPLSFIDNFSEGVNLSTGEYICIIGDDDGINPEIIDAAEWLKKENIDCLSTSITANFVWGDAEVPTTLFTNVTGGVLTISKLSGNILAADPKVELEAFVKGGAINYLNFKLPKLYHGIVRRDCLVQVKNITGNFFGGLSPDIFAAISIACIANMVYVTDYPLTISGVCGVSASIVEGLLKKNSKKLEDAPHLRNRGDYEWSKLVPKVYCVETIWADSAIAALKSMGQDNLINKINLPKLAANCINSNSGISKQVIISLKESCVLRKKNYNISYILLSWNLFVFKLKYIIIFYRRLRNRISIIIGMKNFQRIDGLQNINEATLSLINYLSKKKYIFRVMNKKNIG